MKLKNKILSVLKNSAVDLTSVAYKMGLEEFPLQLNTNDYLYVGYRKPQKNYFFEIKTGNINAGTLSAEYYNGSVWVSCDIVDETKGLKRSNFVYLGEEVYQGVKYAHNGSSEFWVRFKLSANSSAMVLGGLNVLFCGEDDLIAYEPLLKKFYPAGSQSHILSLVAARDYILRRINNAGMYRWPVNDPLAGVTDGFVNSEDFTAFDFFNIDEIRDAAAYIALHFIMRNRSNEGDDVYDKKAGEYFQNFLDSWRLFDGRKVTIDLNRDGKEDQIDKDVSIQRGKFTR